MGCERRVVYDFVNVDQQREANLNQAPHQGQALGKPLHPARLSDPGQGTP